MAKKALVRLTANFERNLEQIERFLTEAEAPQAFDSLLDELLETVIPNLERFPEIGRPFLQRPVRSIEVAHAEAALKQRLAALTSEPGAIREYVLRHYLLLYAVIGDTRYLLAIRHHKQLSFDFDAHWQPPETV